MIWLLVIEFGILRFGNLLSMVYYDWSIGKFKVWNIMN